MLPTLEKSKSGMAIKIAKKLLDSHKHVKELSFYVAQFFI